MRLKKSVQVTTLLILALIGTSCALRDLRPQDAHSNQASSEGHALLDAAAEAHGLDAWRSLDEIELRYKESWGNGMMRSMVSPLPANEQEVKLTFKPNSTFTNEYTMIGGPKSGMQFGMEGMQAWELKKGVSRDRSGMAWDLYAPSMQYYAELPFRLLDASVVYSLGPATLDGQPYDRVFATWSQEADKDVDQYILWIDHETHLVQQVEFTIRAMGKSFAGAAQFDDFKTYDGLVLASSWDLGLIKGGTFKSMHTARVLAVTTKPSKSMAQNAKKGITGVVEGLQTF